MNNIPEVKIGIVAVSRDCFPESLSVNRRKALVEAYRNAYGEGDIYECPICIGERKTAGALHHSSLSTTSLRLSIFPERALDK